jgi:anti-sigma regulatory factor (Ser/Thr protein kinase)
MGYSMSKELVVPGELASLETIGQYVIATAQEAGLDRRATYRLRLAVDEVATNSIVYGYQGNELRGDVVVRAFVDDNALTVTLEDTAPAFDPRKREPGEATVSMPVEEREIGGLGIFLALRGVDEFRYEYSDNRNRNIFVVKRPGETVGD